MKRARIILLILLISVGMLSLVACTLPAVLPNDSDSDNNIEGEAGSENDINSDSPTIPEDVAEGIEYLYDFRFSESYDERVSADFSLKFPEGSLDGVFEGMPIEGESNKLFLLSKYALQAKPESENIYDSDGMSPHKYKDYYFSARDGDLLIKTHFYEPDDVEYISYLWTNIKDCKNSLDVGVGDSEQEILGVYTENLSYITKDELEEVYFSLERLVCDFDYLYVWKPFTLETNEIRDITFYIKDEKIVAIEMVLPYELRYAYRG